MLENRKLEEQVGAIRGEVGALRELADARGTETEELREKVARLSIAARSPARPATFLFHFSSECVVYYTKRVLFMAATFIVRIR